jgi:hypothetical protein
MLTSRLYHNICPYHNAFVFFCYPHFLLHLPIFRAYCQFVVAIYDYLLCPSLFFATSVLIWPKWSYHIGWSLSGKPLSCFCIVIVSKPHMIDVKSYLTSSLSNYWYRNLHRLCQITTIQTYVAHQIFLILSSLLASEFFCLYYGRRFVCARIKNFCLTFCPWCIFHCLSRKNVRDLQHAWYACCRLLTLLVASCCQVKQGGSHGSAYFPCHC